MSVKSTLASDFESTSGNQPCTTGTSVRLSREAEVEIFARLRTLESVTPQNPEIPQLRAFLCEANFGLVLVAVNRSSHRADYDAMLSYAGIAMLHAIRIFDPHRGLKFSTLAARCISRSIGRVIGDCKTRGRRFVTGVDFSSFSTVDLLDTTNEGDVPRLIRVLPERYRAIISHRYGLDGSGFHSMAETASAFGLTKARIGQIEKISLQKMRQEAERLGIAP